jgi:hypothetical protein
MMVDAIPPPVKTGGLLAALFENVVLGFLYLASIAGLVLDAVGIPVPGAEFQYFIFLGMTILISYKFWITYYDPQFPVREDQP